VHLAKLVRNPGIIEDTLRGSRLPGINMRHDAYISS
jgi:hypothetical protein